MADVAPVVDPYTQERDATLTGAQAARAASLGVPLIVPRPGLCTDNAAMIGAAGFFRARAGTRAGLDLDARPSLKLAVRATA